MLIPSIDLKAGRIVQLVQGEKLAVESSDVDGWIAKFRGFKAVQLIDLDAAMATGNNDALVRYVCSKLPCRVGGGVRSATRALELIDAGATHVIVGSSLYRGARAGDPQDSYLNLTFAQELVRVGLPVVLVTRSLRWLPRSAAELKVLPWVAPESGASDVVRAIDEAVGQLDTSGHITLDSSEAEAEDDLAIPQRISEI